LVSHTGGRVDAALGSQIFWHLVRLPIPYFDQRATGTLIARVHAVETIREFISGAAITLLLDLAVPAALPCRDVLVFVAADARRPRADFCDCAGQRTRPPRSVAG